MELPHTLDVVQVAAARAPELRALEDSLAAVRDHGVGGTSLGAAVPPRHMRRRAGSHAPRGGLTRRPNAKRVLAAVSAGGAEDSAAAAPPLGRPARRRLATKVSTSTLRWHAKRFITDVPWPRCAPCTRVALALFGRQHGGRALLRAVGACAAPTRGRGGSALGPGQRRPLPLTRAGCALHDVGAYHVVLHLAGHYANVTRVMHIVAPRADLSKEVLTGRRPLKCVLHAPSSSSLEAHTAEASNMECDASAATQPGQAIGPALAIWQPHVQNRGGGSGNSAQRARSGVLVWVHCTAADDAEAALRAACTSCNDSVAEDTHVVLTRRTDLCRFDMVGAGADAAACAVMQLRTADGDAQWTALPQHVGVFAVTDPRVVRVVTAPACAITGTGVWDLAARQSDEEAASACYYAPPLTSAAVCAALAARRMRQLSTFNPPLGPGDAQSADPQSESVQDEASEESTWQRLAVLLVRRQPAHGSPWSGGWSIICDAAWARPMWNALARAPLAMFARSSGGGTGYDSVGAHVRACGLREWHTLAAAAGASVFPDQWPDTSAGLAADAERVERQRRHALRRPAGKRAPAHGAHLDLPTSHSPVTILRTCAQFMAAVTHQQQTAPDAKHTHQRRATLTQARVAWLAQQQQVEQGAHQPSAFVRVRLELPAGGRVRPGARLHGLQVSSSPDSDTEVAKSAMEVWGRAAGRGRAGPKIATEKPDAWATPDAIGAVLHPLPPPNALPWASVHALVDAAAFWAARLAQHQTGGRGGGPVPMWLAPATSGDGSIIAVLAQLCLEDSVEGDDASWF
jgi:POPLD (NUC188) domain